MKFYFYIGSQLKRLNYNRLFVVHRIIHFALSRFPCIFSITKDVTSLCPSVVDFVGCIVSIILIISLNTATTFQLYFALQSIYEHFHCLRIRLTISFSFSFCTSAVLLFEWLFLKVTVTI